MLKNCFSSLGCPDSSFKELCLLAKNNSVEFFELRSLEGQTDYSAWLSQHPEDLKKCRELLALHQLRIAGLGSSFNLGGHSSADIAGLVSVGRVADVLNVPLVRVFGGGSEKDGMSVEDVKKGAALFVEARDRCRDEGIQSTLMVETHGGLVNSERITQLCDAAGEAVPLLWDTHHTWKIGGEAPAVTFGLIQSQIKHIHVKDSLVDPSDKKGYRFVFTGEGDYPFPELFSLLEKDPMNVCLSLEWEKKWHPELPELSLALKAWVDLFPF